MPVRSNRLLVRSGLPGNGPVGVYTVPADRTAIVKAFVVYLAGSTARSVALGVRSGGVVAYVAAAPAMAAGSHLAAPRDIILEAGDELVTLQDGATSAGSTVYASGSLLYGVDPT